MLLFGPKNDVISKKIKKKSSSPKFQQFFRPKSSDLQKKKEKEKVFSEILTVFPSQIK